MGRKSGEWTFLISAEITTNLTARRHKHASHEAFKNQSGAFVMLRIEGSISFVTCRCRLLASPGLVPPPASSGLLPPSSPAPYSSPALSPLAAFFHPGALCTWRGWTQNSYQHKWRLQQKRLFYLFHIILKETPVIFLYVSLLTQTESLVKIRLV